MRRIVFLLVAFSAPAALAQFNPLDHQHLLYYVPNVADEPGSYFVGNASNGGNATAPGDLVGSVATGLPGVAFLASSIAPGTERRLSLAADGFGNLALQGSSARTIRHNSTSYANTIHQARRLWFIVVFQLDSAEASRPIFDNTNLANDNATGAQGVTIGTQAFVPGGSTGGIPRKTNGAVCRVRIKNATATPIVRLVTEEELAEMAPSRHVLVGYVTPDGLSHLRVDRGRRVYGRVVGAAGTGDAAFGMFLLNRATSDAQHFPGKLLAAGVYSDYPGDAAVAEWLNRWPLGSIAGSSEIRVGGCHLNFSRDQAGMPYCIWYNAQRVSGVSPSDNEEGGNVVFNDGVSTDYLGGEAGWCGGPHRNETLHGATVSIDGAAPTTYSTGHLYVGQSSVRVTRHTTLGISFDQVETATIGKDYHRVSTVLTRKGDSRTVNPLYFRTSRDSTYQDFVAFNLAGEVVHDSSVTSTDFTCDSGVIAVAQYSPSGILALTVVTEGRELNFTTTIFYSANASRRIYHRLNVIPEGTGSVTFETLSKFVPATAGNWKSLAASELLKILNPARSRPRISVGLQNGLSLLK